MKRSIRTLLLSLLLCIFLACIAICGWLLYQESQKPDVMDQYDYEEFQTMVQIIPEPTPQGKTEQDKVEEKEESDPEPVLQYDAQTLLAANPDFLGWLYIPDSHINLPIVAGSDNSWYLTHSFSREYSVFGCPFLDINTPTGSRNRVIHGHNMGSKRTEIFSRLLDYQDQAYAQAHKTLYFSEPEREGETYEVFAVLNFHLSLLDEFDYFQADFEKEEDFQTFVSYLKQNSLYETDYTPTGEILILSTCNRTYGKENRLLVCAGNLSSETLLSCVEGDLFLD